MKQFISTSKMPQRVASVVFTLLTASAAAASNPQPNAQSDSNQEAAGWMEGFPPPPDRIIRNSDQDYFAPPKLKWTVCHLRELLPTKLVHRGQDVPVPLEYSLDPDIGDIQFKRSDNGKTMTWDESYAANHTDGLLVMHDGKVVYERYSGCMDKLGKHAVMSVTKSLTGLIAETLIVEGVIGEDTPAGEIIPELKDSAFGDATIRQILNMTTSLQFDENYADPEADIWQYSAATTPLPKPPGYEGPRSYFGYLQSVKAAGEHGKAFEYKTVNPDAIGWIIARTTGQSVAEILSQRIWQKMGAEQSAYFTIDSIGTPYAGGGLNASLRDMARIGQLMLNDGKLNGEQLIPKQAVDNIQAGADPGKFAKADYETLPGASYKGFWWIYNNKNNAYAARGVHGQTVYIDPTANIVIVRFASHPKATNAANDPTSLPAYQAVADYLIQKSK